MEVINFISSNLIGLNNLYNFTRSISPKKGNPDIVFKTCKDLKEYIGAAEYTRFLHHIKRNYN